MMKIILQNRVLWLNKWTRVKYNILALMLLNIVHETYHKCCPGLKYQHDQKVADVSIFGNDVIKFADMGRNSFNFRFVM